MSSSFLEKLFQSSIAIFYDMNDELTSVRKNM